MLKRAFGSTGTEVSEIGLGCASWWGMPAYSERDAVAIVHQALEGGVTVFDTGASYSRGNAEPRLGRALAGRATDGLIIATKAGTRFVGGRIVRDFSPAAIVASVEQSRRNLQLDTIPLLQLHGPARAEITPALLDTLAGLRAQNRVRWLGLNSFDPDLASWASALPQLDSLMVDYNLLRPERRPLVAAAASAGKAVLAGMPLAMGHAGRQVLKLRRPRDLWYAARALVRHPQDVRRGFRYRFLDSVPGWTAAQAALAYVLADPNVSCAVAGTTRSTHLADLLATSGRQLPEAVMSAIAAAQVDS